MAKSESYVINFKSNNGIKYAALDSRNCLSKQDNPLSLKKFFTHEQATNLVKALRAKGLEEGVEVRVKSLMQSVRDYSYQVLQSAKEVELVDAETMEVVIARYPAKKAEASKPAKAETAEAPAEPEPVEAEVVAEEVEAA